MKMKVNDMMMMIITILGREWGRWIWYDLYPSVSVWGEVSEHSINLSNIIDSANRCKREE